MKICKLILLACLLSPMVYAEEMAGVEFAESASFEGAEKTLKLNGLGIRYKFFFKIYVAALYVEKTSQDAGVLIMHPGAKRMLMHFIYDEVSKKKLVNGWLDGFEDNTSAEVFKALKPRIDQFNAMFETVHKGDVILLDYVPSKGTRVIIKGQEKGVIAGEDFNQALLKIWLGEDPVTEDLKENLLGMDE